MSLIKLKLDSLLDITRAISKNTAEEDLYKIFYFTLLVNPQLSKIAMLVEDKGQWHCKFSNVGGLKSGDTFSLLELNINHFEELLRVNDVFPKTLKNLGLDIIIPINHKEKMLAMVLISEEQLNHIEDDKDYPIISFIKTVSNIIMTAIENKRMSRFALAQEALRKEIEIAREVQRMLLPKSLPTNNKVDLHVKYIPHYSVGGDYYDFIPMNDDEFLLCIADVSGKGVPASMLMSNFQAALRTLAKYEKELDELVFYLNELIYNNSNGNKFISAFFAKCNTKTKTIQYVNAGHPPVYLVSKKGDISRLSDGCTVLGATDDCFVVDVNRITYTEEDILVMYTDGLTEAMNSEGKYYEDKLEAVLIFNRINIDMRMLAKILIRSLNAFLNTDQYSDDLTMFFCKFS